MFDIEQQNITDENCHCLSVSSVSVGTLVLDADLKFRLKRCDYCQSVFWGISPFYKTWNKCLLNSGHCPYKGKRLRFRLHRVVWECPSIKSKVGGGV